MIDYCSAWLIRKKTPNNKFHLHSASPNLLEKRNNPTRRYYNVLWRKNIFHIFHISPFLLAVAVCARSSRYFAAIIIAMATTNILGGKLINFVNRIWIPFGSLPKKAPAMSWKCELFIVSLVWSTWLERTTSIKNTKTCEVLLKCMKKRTHNCWSGSD